MDCCCCGFRREGGREEEVVVVVMVGGGPGRSAADAPESLNLLYIHVRTGKYLCTLCTYRHTTMQLYRFHDQSGEPLQNSFEQLPDVGLCTSI